MYLGVQFYSATFVHFHSAIDKGSALGLPKKAQLMGTPNWSF